MQVIKRAAMLALALCTLAPLVAAAHGNHAKPSANARVAPAWQYEASAAPAVAAAPWHCPAEGGLVVRTGPRSDSVHYEGGLPAEATDQRRRRNAIRGN
jgi:hypothetical protein